MGPRIGGRCRVFGYARVSTEKQSDRGTSLDGQRAELIAYCKREGLPTPDVRVEVEGAGEAAEERRLELLKILGETRHGDIVLVCKIDRWSRHAAFCLGSVEELHRRGVEFRSIAEPGNVITEKLSFGLRALIAEEERHRIFERTIRRRRELRLEGHRVEGMAPIGYRIERRRLVIVPDEADIVRELFKRCIGGSSLRALAEWIQATHGRKLDSSGLSHLFHNRTYLGEMETSGGHEMVAGRPRGRRFGSGEFVRVHEPIIDRLTFDRAARALLSRVRAGRRIGSDSLTKDWLAKGLAKCATCGTTLEARSYAACSPTIRKHGHEGWYVCRKRMLGGCKQGVHLRMAIVDEALAAEVVGKLRSLRSELAKAPAASTAPKPVDFNARRAKLRGKKARIVDAFADGDIPQAEMRQALDQIEDQLRAIDVAEYDHQEAVEASKDDPVKRAAVRMMVVEMARTWAKVSRPERKEIAQSLIDRVNVAHDGQITVEWRGLLS